MTSPLKRYKTPHAGGVFGAVRKYDIHTGIDLYCELEDPVYAIEDGVVVNVCHFTGSKSW
jgi:murein DD-endopeptidase MepM/ murein hydrolase activator NlpD